MLPSLINLTIGAIGAPASDGMVSDAVLMDTSRPILKNRPNKYANDVARKLWGSSWFENDKNRRLEIAEKILKRLFSGRKPNDGVVRVIDRDNIQEFFNATKAEVENPPPPPGAVAPPAKKRAKPRPRSVIPNDDTSDEDNEPHTPPLQVSDLPQDLLAMVLSKVALSGDPCSRLKELCRVDRRFAELCKNGQVYETVNAALGWKGEGSAKEIFQLHCRRRKEEEEKFALPIATGRQVRVRWEHGRYVPEYIFANDVQRRLFLRFDAAQSWLDLAIELFYDTAGQGAYGDVVEGDWEGAGITMEMSREIRLGRAVLPPLKELVDAIRAHWKSNGIDHTEIALLLRRDQLQQEYEDALEENYDDIVGEYRSHMTDNDDQNIVDFNLVLDRFVEAMMVVEDEGEEDE